MPGSPDLWVTALALVFGSYMLGAVPSSYLAARLTSGIDLRRHGSGNVGVSNLAVHAGRGVMPLVLAFDVLVKGSLPVLVASEHVLGLGLTAQAAAGLAAILGHNWSVWLGFAGGRGIATGFGVMAVLSWPLAAAYAGVTGVGWLATRSTALCWAVSIVLLPVWSVVLGLPAEVTAFAVLFMMVIAAKRLVSNPPGEAAGTRPEVPLRQLLLNRLLHDRDVATREEWVRRRPGE